MFFLYAWFVLTQPEVLFQLWIVTVYSSLPLFIFITHRSFQNIWLSIAGKFSSARDYLWGTMPLDPSVLLRLFSLAHLNGNILIPHPTCSWNPSISAVRMRSLLALLLPVPLTLVPFCAECPVGDVCHLVLGETHDQSCTFLDFHKIMVRKYFHEVDFTANLGGSHAQPL